MELKGGAGVDAVGEIIHADAEDVVAVAVLAAFGLEGPGLGIHDDGVGVGEGAAV